MKSPSMTVSCIASLITFVYLINVHANPLQDKCNKENPVLCPASRMCCRGYQFCYNNSNTCEDCFPVSERHDRLKFCSDIERNRTNRTMRDNTCVGACIALYDITEIINYTDKDPVKTQAQLEYELLQEKMNRLNKTLDQRLKQEISNHNSSMHEHLEDSVVKRIVIILAVGILTFIAIIILIAIYVHRRGSKKVKQTDGTETELLLVDDVDKKLRDAFDLDNNTSLFNRSWSPFEKKFNLEIRKITTRVGKLEKKVQNTEETFTKNFAELKPELARLNVSQQQLESPINEIKKHFDDKDQKLINAFGLENTESLFSKTGLLNKTTSRIEEQEKRLQETSEKFTNINVDVKNANANSQQPSHSGLDALQEFLDTSLDKKMNPINEKLTFLMQKISNQEKIALASDQTINKASQSTLDKGANKKRAYSPMEGVSNMSLRRSDEDVELSAAD